MKMEKEIDKDLMADEAIDAHRRAREGK